MEMTREFRLREERIRRFSRKKIKTSSNEKVKTMEKTGEFRLGNVNIRMQSRKNMKQQEIKK